MTQDAALNLPLHRENFCSVTASAVSAAAPACHSSLTCFLKQVEGKVGPRRLWQMTSDRGEEDEQKKEPFFEERAGDTFSHHLGKADGEK